MTLRLNSATRHVISANPSTAVTKLSDWLRQRGLILNETKSHLLALLSSSVCRTQTGNTTDRSHLRENTPPASLLSQVHVSWSDRGQHVDIQGAQVLLNRAVRTVFGVDLPTQHSAEPLLTRLGVFQVSEHFHQNTLALVWKSLHGETSQSVTQLMTPQMTRETHLQQQNGLSLPVARTNAGKSRYAFNATGKWNS